MATRGIHLVWTCYLTWLPGDDRGHWSPLFDLYGRLIDHGHKLQMPDPTTKRRSIELAREPAMLLSDAAEKVVAAALADHVSNGLRVHAAAIEATHVHLLISPPLEDLHRVVGRLKGTTSSAVLRLPEHADRSRTWTAGYWKVFLFDDQAVIPVRQYIEHHNLRRGLPPAPWPWITT